MEIEFVFAPPPGTPAKELEQADTLRYAYARNRVEVKPAESSAAWWCGLFGVARQVDWPVAPFRLDAATAGSGYWLCVDPLHMQFDRDRLLFDPGALDDFDMAQAQELLGVLNAHFAADGLAFSAVSPREWVLRVPRAQDLHMPSPPDANGLPAMLTLPQGLDAAWARRLSNEAQMLLHQAPLNAAREARRQWPVNSVWLWGGGTRGPVAPAPQIAQVFSSAKHVRGLAESAGCKTAALPADWSLTSQSIDPSAAGKLLIDLTEIGAQADWPRHLQQNWLLPAASLAKTQKFTFRLTLLLRGHSLSTRLYRSDLFHFFRRKSLADYVDNIQNQADS